MILLST